MPVNFSPDYSDWLQRNVPATVGRLRLLFEIEHHLQRIYSVASAYPEDPECVMLCVENGRLMRMCHDQQLEIHTTFLISYHQDVMLRAGLYHHYNGGGGGPQLPE